MFQLFKRYIIFIIMRILYTSICILIVFEDIPNVLFRLKNLRPEGMVTYCSASQTSLLALSIFSFGKLSNFPIKVLNLNKCRVNLQCIKGIRRRIISKVHFGIIRIQWQRGAGPIDHFRTEARIF